MKLADEYQINAPNVIHEIIDGEAIIVNMEKGHYYSLQGTGAEIWADIVNGFSVMDIVNQLATRYQKELALIQPIVEEFLLELHKEEMIIPISSPGGSSHQGDKHENMNNPLSQPFEIPVLEKFTDMEELLLLDPIHEVDQDGWPLAAPDGNGEGV